LVFEHLLGNKVRKKVVEEEASCTGGHPAENQGPVTIKQQLVDLPSLLLAQARNNDPPSNEERLWKDKASRKAEERAEKQRPMERSLRRKDRSQTR